MDIKRNRRDAAVMGKVWDKDLPMVEGMYPADSKKGIGTAASDNNIGWDIRAQSWQRGADTDCFAIDAEKRENDLKFGVPYADNLPAPSDPAGPPNCGARYQTASYNANDTLPNPHNFSSNPGFMSASTGDMSSMGGPANGGTARISTPGSGRSLRGTGTIGRTAVASTGNVALPAPGDVNPGQEGGPQVVSSGYSG
jgi:hypothetical protein